MFIQAKKPISKSFCGIRFSYQFIVFFIEIVIPIKIEGKNLPATKSNKKPNQKLSILNLEKILE